MRAERRSGLLLHPTCLPGGHGTGDLGPAAREFADFLAAAGQSVWQVLAAGPTGFSESPYQSFSEFAGNPLWISLEMLVRDGLLDARSIEGMRFPEGRAEFDAARALKWPLLERAARAAAGEPEFEEFCRREAEWLDDFAEFLALKRLYDGEPWWTWDRPHREREQATMAELGESQKEAIHRARFEQWVFERQWNDLRAYCRARGIRLFGDLPPFAAADSADVWRHPEQWALGDDRRPAWMAGAPPDTFNPEGQIWGNPVCRWEEMERDGFRWWIARLRKTMRRVDVVRLDHFRGYQAYWQVPAGALSPTDGVWRPGPGSKLFRAAQAALGPLPVVAENLGLVTGAVEALRAEFGWPGMAVLTHAFGGDPRAAASLPHNYTRAVVAFSSTHDTDTLRGWWIGLGQRSRERRRAAEYLETPGWPELRWRAVRALMGSVADTVIFPAQDVAGLGSECRLNRPGTGEGNWRWRLRPGDLTRGDAGRLAALARLYERLPAGAGLPRPSPV